MARLAKQLAELTGVPDLPAAAEAAGWLHDVGKYRKEFQDFIRGDPPRGSKQHKEAGAAWAAKDGDQAIAFAVLGHHHGIPDKDDAITAVRGSDGLDVARNVADEAALDCAPLRALAIRQRGDATPSTELFTRLLLSCLVDADWTDTTEHDRDTRQWPVFSRAPDLRPAERLAAVLAFIEQRAADCRHRNGDLVAVRQQILDECLGAAACPPGLFSLTVPTGGGKTLSSVAFALKHAAQHQLRRIIYVAPYTSILDQNAAVLRQALGIASEDLTVFEHQSLAEPQGPQLADEMQTSAAARLAENWDSPVILTTNVQFFESLFSNKPSRCRKLHNIARSVIILDECQAIPPDLVKATCQMLKQVVADLGSTVVLCTATQPGFSHECLCDERLDHRLMPTEIIPKTLDLFASLKRVRLEWPARDERLSWKDTAGRILATPAALCVVNTKRAAKELFTELVRETGHVFHLSTAMCPAHRLEVLSAVKRRLASKKPVFLVSTQLIEAGVDIDFPVVFREMAPLESIIQAAGRCNREGMLKDGGGQVQVFRSEEGGTPGGWYDPGREVLETEFLAAGREPRIDAAADLAQYFHHLYWKRALDPKNIVGMRAGFKFASVASAMLSPRLWSFPRSPRVIGGVSSRPLRLGRGACVCSRLRAAGNQSAWSRWRSGAAWRWPGAQWQ